MTKEQAIKANNDIIAYIDSHPGQTDEEIKFIGTARKWAFNYIARLSK